MLAAETTLYRLSPRRMVSIHEHTGTSSLLTENVSRERRETGDLRMTSFLH